MEQPGLSQGGGTGSIQGTRTKEVAPGDSRAWGQAAAPFPSPRVRITQSSWGTAPLGAAGSSRGHIPAAGMGDRTAGQGHGLASAQGGEEAAHTSRRHIHEMGALVARGKHWPG